MSPSRGPRIPECEAMTVLNARCAAQHPVLHVSRAPRRRRSAPNLGLWVMCLSGGKLVRRSRDAQGVKTSFRVTVLHLGATMRMPFQDNARRYEMICRLSQDR